MAFAAADAVGVLGLVFLLSGFVPNVLGRLGADTYAYQVLNLLGSGFLGVYAWLVKSWVFVPLEVIWAGVALWAVLRKARGKPAITPVP